jgi:large subunit ribosomal protein L15
MKFNDLKISRNKNSTRVGRGISAGKGKTAGRGTKGQGARKSGGVRPGFEGGQTPIYMRIPKLRGFKSHRQPIVEIKTGEIEKIGKSKIDANTLANEGLIENPFVNIKVIVGGEDLKKKVEVNLPSASASAVKVIEKAGGKFSTTPRLKRPKTDKKKA